MKIIALIIALSCGCLARTYSTSFSATENPISEGGNWLNGAADGTSWGNVKTSSSQAHGTIINGAPPFDDSTAVVSGSWGSNQTVTATVKINGTNATTQEEVELRVNTTITASSITGYECDFNVKNGNTYVTIVRWNGALNDFTYCVNGGTCSSGSPTSTAFNALDGDTISCVSSGGTITLTINGVTRFSTSDATYSNGGPGVGFWQEGGTTGNLLDFGLASFSATDGVSSTCGPTQGAKISNGAMIKCF